MSLLSCCLALAVLLSTAEAQTSSEGWVNVGGRFLKFFAKPMQFDEAVATCAGIGGLLAYDDHPLVHLYLARNGQLQWIGASDEGHEGKWTWTNGASVGAGHWAPGEPNNLGGRQNCAVVNFRKPGHWDDQNCKGGPAYPFHCQVHRIGYSYGVSGRVLKVHAEKKSWAEAQSVCHNEGGELVKVDTKQVNDWLANQKLKDLWIDAFDKGHEGKWTTSDGRAAMGDFWYKGEPNNLYGQQDCAVVNFINPGKWDDQACIGPNSFVCQIML